jgi:hypothetical protein
MKKASLIARILAASAALSPLLLATAALAADLSTYSSTPQSAVVEEALRALSSGDRGAFANLADEGIAPQFDQHRAALSVKAGDVDPGKLNLYAQRTGHMRPDSWGGVVSNRVYQIQVHTPGYARIWDVSVRCMGISLLDAFGSTNRNCKIAKISAPGPSSEQSAGRAPAVIPQSLADGGIKNLPAESLAPADATAAPGKAVQARPN